MSKYIPKIIALFVLIFGISMAVIDEQHTSSLFAAVWGVIGAIGCWFYKWEDHVKYQSLPPVVQLILAVILVLSFLISTHWNSLSGRDFIQLGSTIFALPVFWDGIRKTISLLKPSKN